MLLPEHDFIKPRSLAEGLAVLRDAPPGVRLLGGGTDVVFNMRCRLMTPDTVLSLKDLPELQGVAVLPDGSLRLGAASRLTDLIATPVLRERYPALVKAFRAVASRHVRNLATLGGNLCLDTRCWFTNQTKEWRDAKGPCLKTGTDVCHAIQGSPVCVALNNADSPPALIALDATVTLASSRGERTLALQDFYRDDGIRHTVLEPDEILTCVTVPPTADRLVFLKETARQGMDFSYGTIAIRADGRGASASRLRIVIGSLTTSPRHLAGAAERLAALGLGDEGLAAACATLRDALGPLTNLYSPAAYKRELAKTLLRKAVLELRDIAA
ncbi:MAG: FAD binding domain-containing protein, partial [Gammaproteobacteria bacterium]